MFAGIYQQDIEVYAGVDNLIKIKLENNEGDRIKLLNGTFDAGIKLNITSKEAVAKFDVTNDDELILRLSTEESSKLLNSLGRQEKNGCYDVIFIADDNKRFAVVYGDVLIKRGVMVNE